jgi:hypothetical protein
MLYPEPLMNVRTSLESKELAYSWLPYGALHWYNALANEVFIYPVEV